MSTQVVTHRLAKMETKRCDCDGGGHWTDTVPHCECGWRGSAWFFQSYAMAEFNGHVQESR